MPGLCFTQEHFTHGRANPLRQPPSGSSARPERHRPDPCLETDHPERPQNFSRGLAGPFWAHPDLENFWEDHARLHLYALACSDPAGGAGCRSRRSGGRLEFRDSLGLLRALRSPDHSSRPVEPGCRAKTAGTHHGAVREVGRAGRPASFTFAASAKHVNLYQRFGFWPRFLVLAPMSKGVERAGDANHPLLLFNARRSGAGSRCLPWIDLGAIYEGLDVSLEIRLIYTQRLGDTVLLWGGEIRFGRLRGLPRRRGHGGRTRQLLRQVCRRAAEAGRGAAVRTVTQGCEAARRGPRLGAPGSRRQPGPQPGLSLHAATWFSRRGTGRGDAPPRLAPGLLPCRTFSSWTTGR